MPAGYRIRCHYSDLNLNKIVQYWLDIIKIGLLIMKQVTKIVFSFDDHKPHVWRKLYNKYNAKCMK